LFGGITCEGYQALPLLDRLCNWPSEQKVNWTELGREFNIPGKNKDQVVKEFSRSMELMSFSLTIDLLTHGYGLASFGCQEEMFQFLHTELWRE